MFIFLLDSFLSFLSNSFVLFVWEESKKRCDLYIFKKAGQDIKLSKLFSHRVYSGPFTCSLLSLGWHMYYSDKKFSKGNSTLTCMYQLQETWWKFSCTSESHLLKLSVKWSFREIPFCQSILLRLIQMLIKSQNVNILQQVPFAGCSVIIMVVRWNPKTQMFNWSLRHSSPLVLDQFFNIATRNLLSLVGPFWSNPTATGQIIFHPFLALTVLFQVARFQAACPPIPFTSYVTRMTSMWDRHYLPSAAAPFLSFLFRSWPDQWTDIFQNIHYPCDCQKQHLYTFQIFDTTNVHFQLIEWSAWPSIGTTLPRCRAKIIATCFPIRCVPLQEYRACISGCQLHVKITCASRNSKTKKENKSHCFPNAEDMDFKILGTMVIYTACSEYSHFTSKSIYIICVWKTPATIVVLCVCRTPPLVCPSPSKWTPRDTYCTGGIKWR